MMMTAAYVKPLKESDHTFLEMVESYAKFYGLDSDKKTLKAESIEWSMTRGNRSGRVAWQYVQDLAGRMGKIL